MTAIDYREKYKRLGVCVSHPEIPVMPGHVHCIACVMNRRVAGSWFHGHQRTSKILGVRVKLGLLKAILKP